MSDAAPGLDRSSPSALRISALATHPIQYHAPWYRELAAHDAVDLTVLFEYLPDERAQGEGFGVPFQWDLPLLTGYRHVVLSGDGRRSRWRSLFRLVRHLHKQRPDVLLLTGWHSAVLLAAPTVARMLDCARLVRGESNDLKSRPRWMRPLHRCLLSRYDGFLPIGTANRRFFNAHGVRDEQMTDCPYFVDNQRFVRGAENDDGARQRIRKQFAIAPDATCFMFVGKLEDKKRPADFVAAMRALGDDNAHALIVGSGELLEALRRQAQGLPVSFAGFVNQSAIGDFYQAADCIVLPSNCGETWGLVVNEAMAGARPVIVSDEVGCAQDLVRPGDTGWRYPMGDVQALSGAMRAALRDPVALRRMGVAAQALVVNDFCVARASDAVVHAAQALRRNARDAGRA